MSTPETTLAVYDRIAGDWDRYRDRRLTERAWLDRMLAAAPRNKGKRTVLDLGCGSGRPIATYLADRGAQITGVDGAPRMTELFTHNLPSATVHTADMRGLDLGRTFSAILAWDSFFHLSPADQRQMFAVFAQHAAPDTILMFTSGPDEGVEMGEVVGEAVYHASLSPEAYRDLLTRHGFEELMFKPEDPDCGGHSVWLAKFTGA
ncbi:class I SAM-dependent DNA methyltransferase [Marivivens aquimaris]|uniref:class I SAM-dependent DNA methyltransferase n=1 Tax=Marivivens aquimaris TaxID=2774876 RepID=UPI0018812AF6|nr:class I SAM-dependent methyltransferase [Marivivens aquimaris]